MKWLTLWFVAFMAWLEGNVEFVLFVFGVAAIIAGIAIHRMQAPQPFRREDFMPLKATSKGSTVSLLDRVKGWFHKEPATTGPSPLAVENVVLRQQIATLTKQAAELMAFLHQSTPVPTPAAPAPPIAAAPPLPAAAPVAAPASSSGTEKSLIVKGTTMKELWPAGAAFTRLPAETSPADYVLTIPADAQHSTPLHRKGRVLFDHVGTEQPRRSMILSASPGGPPLTEWAVAPENISGTIWFFVGAAVAPAYSYPVLQPGQTYYVSVYGPAAPMDVDCYKP